MQDFWNARYSESGYAYGTRPNTYFKSVIDTLPPGRLLVPGAGEGRDAVYAATLGWQVDAFDLSSAGREKALRLAADNQVQVNYTVQNAADFQALSDTYDLIAMIFFHLPQPLRGQLAPLLVQSLRPGGLVLLEAFTPRQLQYDSGGPKTAELLLTASQVQADFPDLQVLECRELDTELDEGPYHRGMAAVVRYLGRKNTDAL